MEIKDNRITAVKAEVVLEPGDLVRGSFSHEWYLIISDGRAVRLDNGMKLVDGASLIIRDAHVKKENITITLEGEK